MNQKQNYDDGVGSHVAPFVYNARNAHAWTETILFLKIIYLNIIIYEKYTFISLLAIIPKL